MVVNHKCRSVRRYLQNKVHSKYCTLPPPVGNLLCFNFRSFLFRDSRLEMRHAKCQWFSSNTFSIFYSFHFILLLLDQEDWLVIGDDELDKLKNSEIALGRIEGSVRVAVSLTFFRFRFDYEKESDHHQRSTGQYMLFLMMLAQIQLLVGILLRSRVLGQPKSFVAQTVANSRWCLLETRTARDRIL